MSSSSEKSASKSLLSVQNIVLAGIAWALLALVFFLLGGVAPPGEEYPIWYQVGTTVFELGAYLAAALLCFRNWRSPQIVSGRNVWLALSLGMLCYFIGTVLFFYWETVLGQEADVSPGDFFYVLTYIFLCWGMISAVFSRRLNLEVWQMGIVAGIAIAGIVLGLVISSGPQKSETPASFLMPPAMAQAPAATPATQPKPAPKATPAKPTPAKPAAKTSPAAKPTPKPTAPKASPSPVAAPSPAAEPAAPEKPAKPAPPAWVTAIEEQLAPLKSYIDWFIVLSDIVLLVTATTLLLAFWGGRSSLSWRMIAAAAFSLYLADIWFKYATTQLPDYKSGSPPEVFWIFSGVLFAIGAALEFDLSTRSQRSGRRRRGA